MDTEILSLRLLSKARDGGSITLYSVILHKLCLPCFFHQKAVSEL